MAAIERETITAISRDENINLRQNKTSLPHLKKSVSELFRKGFTSTIARSYH